MTKPLPLTDVRGSESGAVRAKRGWFITLEGPEGSGKSTQLRLLGKRLRGARYDVLETAEPGGTPISSYFLDNDGLGRAQDLS
jgi:dTMP kinase